MTRRLFFFSLALFLAFSSGLAPADETAARPFRGRVTGQWDNIFNGLFNPPANFAGGGPVTHMGDTGGRYLDTTPLTAGLKRTTEPNAVRNFGTFFQPTVGVATAGPETLVNATTAGTQG